MKFFEGAGRRLVSAFLDYFVTGRTLRLVTSDGRSSPLGNLASESHENLYSSQLQSLRSLLRRFPYWVGGHLQLSKLSLNLNDVGTAYAGAQAALLLGNNDQRSDAQLVLARCFLKRGAPERATSLLKELLSHGVQTPSVREELAAAHLAEGDLVEAHEQLRAVPAESLSPEGKLALRYVLSKLAGDSDER